MGGQGANRDLVSRLDAEIKALEVQINQLQAAKSHLVRARDTLNGSLLRVQPKEEPVRDVRPCPSPAESSSPSETAPLDTKSRWYEVLPEVMDGRGEMAPTEIHQRLLGLGLSVKYQTLQVYLSTHSKKASSAIRNTGRGLYSLSSSTLADLTTSKKEVTDE